MLELPYPFQTLPKDSNIFLNDDSWGYLAYFMRAAFAQFIVLKSEYVPNNPDI